MELVRQHNIAIDRQRDRGEWSSFYGPPPVPARETQHIGGIPEVEGPSLRRPPADRDFPQAASAAMSTTPATSTDIGGIPFATGKSYTLPPAPPGLYAGTGVVGASSKNVG
eukprot:7411318-Prorocentrum_lima.AAC.1